MRAIGFHTHGGVEQLESLSVPRPACGEEEVLVDVRATALNHGDLLVLRELREQVDRYPHWGGMDFAGVVASVGEAVTGWAVGDRVVVDPFFEGIGARGVQRRGGLAEFAAVPGEKLIRIPDGTAFHEAAAVPVAGGTSYETLVYRGAVEETDSLLVVGATGGVGSFSVRIADELCDVETLYAVTSTERKADFLAGLGVDHVLEYDRFDERVWELTGEVGVDAVYNNVGGETWRRSLRSLREGGRLMVSGDAAGSRPETELRYLYLRNLTVLGNSGTTHDHLRELLGHVYESRIEPVVRTYEFDEYRAAFDRLDSRRALGKLVLTQDASA